MKFQVLENITLKTGNGNIELRKGQTVEVQPEKVKRLIELGKIKPVVEELPAGYELAERMAIMGENTEPEQIEPYATDFGVLVIPWNSDPKYHYWKHGGQSVCDTLMGLGRCDLIPRYKSIYSN